MSKYRQKNRDEPPPPPLSCFWNVPEGSKRQLVPLKRTSSSRAEIKELSITIWHLGTRHRDDLLLLFWVSPYMEQKDLFWEGEHLALRKYCAGRLKGWPSLYRQEPAHTTGWRRIREGAQPCPALPAKPTPAQTNLGHPATLSLGFSANCILVLWSQKSGYMEDTALVHQRQIPSKVSSILGNSSVSPHPQNRTSSFSPFSVQDSGINPYLAQYGYWFSPPKPQDHKNNAFDQVPCLPTAASHLGLSLKQGHKVCPLLDRKPLPQREFTWLKNSRLAQAREWILSKATAGSTAWHLPPAHVRGSCLPISHCTLSAHSLFDRIFLVIPLCFICFLSAILSPKDTQDQGQSLAGSSVPLGSRSPKSLPYKCSSQKRRMREVGVGAE